jgi:stage V sporulation protein B
MIPTSVSQIIETASKLVFGLTAAWWLVRAGESMSIGAAGAIFGVSMGTLLALVYIIIYTNRMKRRNKAPTGKPDIPDSRSRILKQLAMIGIPIVIGSCVLSLVGMIDTKMIFSRLQNSVGLDYDQTNILYGVYFSTQTYTICHPHS